MLFEFFRLPHMRRRELLSRVEVVGREHLEKAVERGRGVVICCTHVGNWELAAVVLAYWGYTLHAVAGVQLGRWLTQAVRETKSELAIHTVAPEDGFRKLIRALEHNEVVDAVLLQPNRRAQPAEPAADNGNSHGHIMN